MPLLRVLKKTARSERVTPADLFDAPSEQLIAQGRLILCGFASLMIYLTPAPPAQNAVAVFIVLLAYSVFAVTLVALTGLRFLSSTARYFIHITDIASICALLFVADGTVTPLFFVFFIFTLLAATLRWHWQAVVATTWIFALTLLIAGITHQIFSAPLQGDMKLNTVILGSAYLIAAGAMVAYVSSFRIRNRDRLARLGHWPTHSPGEEHALSLPQILSHSANVLAAPQVFVIWQEAEEPYVFLSSWRGSSYQEKRERAGTFGSVVAPELTSAAFFTNNVSSEVAILSKGPVHVKGPVIDRGLIEEFSMQAVSTAPFKGTGCSGRIFVCDCDCWSDDHLLLSKIIGFRVATALDRQAYQRRNEEAIAAQERIRLTRDLHDGILQNLTAASLHLNLAESSANRDRRSRLGLVKKLLANEQRRIREFVEEPKPKAVFGEQTVLRSDLEEILDESAAQWNCKTALSIAPPDAKVPRSLFGQLSFMLAEAVANAVRHGGASNIDVAVEKTSAELLINIRDNGKGFNGRPLQREQEELTVPDKAPVSLRERVGALGGSLRVTTSSKGAQLAIRVPVQ